MKKDIKTLRKTYSKAADPNPAIEEINRRERERSRKAQLLGIEHGKLGQYDPPSEILRDSSMKLAYDLGYLNTKKK